jgi:hypothetical protein
MKYQEYEMAFSKARMNRYMTACGGNTRKAMQLYRYNVKLCQKYYGALGAFEIVLRNAVDRHYRASFNDPDWIIHQLQPGGMLEFSPHKSDAFRHYGQLISKGFYTPDKMVSAQSFGFWTYMFNQIPFNAGGRNLLAIFPNKQLGVGQRAVFNDLKEIKTFRNRIAHHEPICFDPSGKKSLVYAFANYKLIVKYFEFLGYKEKEILYGFDMKTVAIARRIMRI